MKLIFAIVQDADSQKLVNNFMKNAIPVTKLATTGGFLRTGNTTLMIGINDERVEETLGIIEHTCRSRKQTVNNVTVGGDSGAVSPELLMTTADVTVGGATVFVMEVDKCVKY